MHHLIFILNQNRRLNSKIYFISNWRSFGSPTIYYVMSSRHQRIRSFISFSSTFWCELDVWVVHSEYFLKKRKVNLYLYLYLHLFLVSCPRVLRWWSFIFVFHIAIVAYFTHTNFPKNKMKLQKSFQWMRVSSRSKLKHKRRSTEHETWNIANIAECNLFGISFLRILKQIKWTLNTRWVAKLMKHLKWNENSEKKENKIKKTWKGMLFFIRFILQFLFLAFVVVQRHESASFRRFVGC